MANKYVHFEDWYAYIDNEHCLHFNISGVDMLSKNDVKDIYCLDRKGSYLILFNSGKYSIVDYQNKLKTEAPEYWSWLNNLGDVEQFYFPENSMALCLTSNGKLKIYALTWDELSVIDYTDDTENIERFVFDCETQKVVLWCSDNKLYIKQWNLLESKCVLLDNKF